MGEFIHPDMAEVHHSEVEALRRILRQRDQQIVELKLRVVYLEHGTIPAKAKEQSC